MLQLVALISVLLAGVTARHSCLRECDALAGAVYCSNSSGVFPIRDPDVRCTGSLVKMERVFISDCPLRLDQAALHK